MTLAAVAAGATILGGAVSAMGAIQAGNAQASAAMRDEAIAERNAKIANQDRIQAVRTAQTASEDKARANRRQLASLRAAYGSSGFELAGSSLDVLADTSTEMALDERRIEYEGTVRNREGALQMLYLSEDADQSRRAAKNYVKAGRISAGASLFSTAGSAANGYSQYGNA